VRTKGILIGGVLMAALVLSTVACGGGSKKSDKTSTPTVSQNATSVAATATRAAAGTTPGTTTSAGTTPAATSSSSSDNTPEATSDSSTEGYNACTLITQDDAVHVLGQQVGAGQLSPTTTSTQAIPGVTITIQSCVYTSTTTSNSLSAAMWSVVPAGATTLKDGVTAICASKEKISDLGQVACWNDNNHDEIKVLQDAVYLDLSVPGGEGVGEDLRTLAETAINELD
jgi:hypothetical protein